MWQSASALATSAAVRQELLRDVSLNSCVMSLCAGSKIGQMTDVKSKSRTDFHWEHSLDWRLIEEKDRGNYKMMAKMKAKSQPWNETVREKLEKRMSRIVEVNFSLYYRFDHMPRHDSKLQKSAAYTFAWNHNHLPFFPCHPGTGFSVTFL